MDLSEDEKELIRLSLLDTVDHDHKLLKGDQLTDQERSALSEEIEQCRILVKKMEG